MSLDLPDYTQSIAVNVALPEIDIGSTNVGRYVLAPADLADGERAPLLADVKGRIIAVVRQLVAAELQATVTPAAGETFTVGQSIGSALQGEMWPRPKGSVLAKNSQASAAAYATIVSYAPTSGKKLQLSKIMMSTSKAAWFKFRWASADISAERLLDDKSILMEHFLKDYYSMTGDGAKLFEVQAKYDSETGTVSVEVVGEEE